MLFKVKVIVSVSKDLFLFFLVVSNQFGSYCGAPRRHTAIICHAAGIIAFCSSGVCGSGRIYFMSLVSESRGGDESSLRQDFRIKRTTFTFNCL